MYVATLIAAPAGPGLDRAAIRAVADTLGATGEESWLDPTHAVDLALPAVPEAAQRDAAAGLARASGFDMVVQWGPARAKSILIADMDSTMIDQECIDELAAEIGIKPQVAAITARAMNGEIAFEPALRERVALLKGLSEAVIATVIANRITLASGGATLVATMRARGAYAALVSGGFTAFTSQIASRLGFDEHRANHLNVENGELTGTVSEPILGSDAKLTALREIAAARGVSIEDALAVGDGANDLAMIERAGTGVALHAKPSVAAQAPHRIDHGDLTALLYMQGYRRQDFVTR